MTSTIANDAEPSCVGHPSETYLKLKSREIFFDHNIHFGGQIASKFCTTHDSNTAMLRAKYEYDSTTAKWVIDERDFTRFEFKMNFLGDIIYCNTVPNRCCCSQVSICPLRAQVDPNLTSGHLQEAWWQARFRPLPLDGMRVVVVEWRCRWPQSTCRSARRLPHRLLLLKTTVNHLTMC